MTITMGDQMIPAESTEPLPAVEIQKLKDSNVEATWERRGKSCLLKTFPILVPTDENVISNSIEAEEIEIINGHGIPIETDHGVKLLSTHIGNFPGLGQNFTTKNLFFTAKNQFPL